MAGEQQSLDQALDALAAKAAEAEAGEEAAAQTGEGADQQPVEAQPEAEQQPEAQPEGGEEQSATNEGQPAKAQQQGTKPGQVPAEKERPQGAPRTWSPAMREAWGTLPPAVRAQILKREGDFSREITRRDQQIAKIVKESKEYSEGYRRFAEAIAPFKSHLDAVGVEPVAALKSLFTTEYTLRTGTPAQKAQVVASLMSGYGVDVPTLAAVLDGKAPAEGAQPQAAPQPPPAPPQPAPIRDSRFDAFMVTLQERAREREAAKLDELRASGEAEFLDDVLPDMAELAKLPKNAGLSMRQLYEKACLLNDDVRSLMEQRKAEAEAAKKKAEQEQALRQQSQRAVQSRMAASSVATEPSAPRGGKRPSLEEAMMGVVSRHSR